MSVEKSLKFQFVLDDTSFNRVKRSLDEIIAKGKELAKVLGGAGAPGGGGGGFGLLSGGNVGRAGAPGQGPMMPGASPMSKLLNDNAAAFKNMANLGSSSFRGLTDALRTNIRNQTQELSRLQGALDKLGHTYERLGGQGSKAAAVQQAMVRVAGRITGGQQNMQGLQNMLGQATGGAPIAGPATPWGVNLPAPSGGGGGGGGGVGGGGRGGAGGLPPGMPGFGSNPMVNWFLGNTMGAQAARLGGAVTAGAGIGYGITQLFQRGNNFQLDVNAQRGQAVQQPWQQLRQGNYSQLAAMQFISRQTPEARQRILQSVGSTEADFGDVVGAFKGTLGGNLAAMGGMDTEKYKRMQEQLAKVQSTMGFQATFGRGMEYVDQSRGDRATLSRMGLGGFYFNKQTGAFEDRYSKTAQSLEAGGFNTGEYAGAVGQARQLGFGRGQMGVGWDIMGASAAGFGQVGDVLAGAARSGGFGNARSLAQSALGGGIQTAAGLQLGQSLFGFDPRGTVSGAGALAAIQGGMQFTGGISDMNQVARAQLGMQSFDRLGAGFDPYQQGRNLVSSIGAMPGGTTYQQDVLGGKMSTKELLEVARGGEGGPLARAFGITQQAAQTQLSGQAAGIFGRYVEQGGNDPVSKAMRAMRASGMSETDFLSQLGGEARGKGAGAKEARSQLEALGAYAGVEMGGDAEGGVGMVEMMSGIKGLAGRKLKEGKLPYGSVDDLERKQREQGVIELKKQQEALEKTIGGITEAIKGLGGAEEKTAGFGMLKGSVETLVNDFADLSAATKNLVGVMGGSVTGQQLGKGLSTSANKKAGAAIDEARRYKAGSNGGL